MDSTWSACSVVFRASLCQPPYCSHIRVFSTTDLREPTDTLDYSRHRCFVYSLIVVSLLVVLQYSFSAANVPPLCSSTALRLPLELRKQQNTRTAPSLSPIDLHHGTTYLSVLLKGSSRRSMKQRRTSYMATTLGEWVPGTPLRIKHYPEKLEGILKRHNQPTNPWNRDIYICKAMATSPEVR